MTPVFCTALHKLKSPQNVGTIVRTHVAMGGSELCFIGQQAPWEFRKSSQAFSRKLERLCEMLVFPDAERFFDWCIESSYSPVGIEIAPGSTRLDAFTFPERSSLIFGNEAEGLPDAVLNRCSSIVRVPQAGPVGSLNVGIVAGITMYELRRGRVNEAKIVGSKFGGEALALEGRR